MSEKKEVIGYYAEDGNIYCVECINKNSEIMKIRNVSSQMRHFHQEFSVEPPRLLEAVY